MTGRVHSIQSMGTLDGPGIRYVIFLAGCNLRCGCCHNPDTWNIADGKEYTAEELIGRALRFREYFGDEGGITLSGGEPLLQAEFAAELFALAKEKGINTCLDTSGSILNDKVKALLSHTDRVLLDVKYTDDESYRRHVGCSIDAPLAFLDYLDREGIKTTVRQVIIPTLNDTKESIERLKNVTRVHPCVDKIELLPFRKVCSVKYDKLGIDFPFANLPTPSAEEMKKLEKLLFI